MKKKRHFASFTGDDDTDDVTDDTGFNVFTLYTGNDRVECIKRKKTNFNSLSTSPCQCTPLSFLLNRYLPPLLLPLPLKKVDFSSFALSVNPSPCALLLPVDSHFALFLRKKFNFLPYMRKNNLLKVSCYLTVMYVSSPSLYLFTFLSILFASLRR